MIKNPEQSQSTFVNWFRDSAPYIHAHRSRTFVVSFGGEVVLSANFSHHIHDFALLNSLGIRLVLIHGIRPQINHGLQKQGLSSKFHHNLRITDKIALECVKQAVSVARIEIEALLSMGLANSPMSGAKVRISSGNFVTAKPIGVIDGIDYCHTGKVRRIDSEAIHQQLNQNNVVLISPIGYSPSGEIFNLCAEKVATEVAIALQAEKLILMTEKSCCHLPNQQTIPQMTVAEAQNFINETVNVDDNIKRPLTAAIQACKAGIKRVHLVNRKQEGVLLLELFSHNGIGTLISALAFEKIRPATLDDIKGILNIIVPLEKQGKLIERSQQNLERQIADYMVIESDGLILGCAALQSDNQHSAVLACVAIHTDYRKAQRGNKLLEAVYKQAKQQGLTQLFVLSTQTMHWFIERGFQPIAITELPAQLKQNYNNQRNPKVLVKDISDDGY